MVACVVNPDSWIASGGRSLKRRVAEDAEKVIERLRTLRLCVLKMTSHLNGVWHHP